MTQQEFTELREDVKQISKDVVEIKTKMSLLPCGFHASEIEALKKKVWLWSGGLGVIIALLGFLIQHFNH